MEIPKCKVFSTIKAKVSSIVQADYIGCVKCRRKLTESLNHGTAVCLDCNLTNGVNYQYGKIVLTDSIQR